MSTSELQKILLRASEHSIPIRVEGDRQASGSVVSVAAGSATVRDRVTSVKTTVRLSGVRRVTRFDGRELWSRADSEGGAA